MKCRHQWKLSGSLICWGGVLWNVDVAAADQYLHCCIPSFCYIYLCVFSEHLYRKMLTNHRNINKPTSSPLLIAALDAWSWYIGERLIGRAAWNWECHTRSNTYNENFIEPALHMLRGIILPWRYFSRYNETANRDSPLINVFENSSIAIENIS